LWETLSAEDKNLAKTAEELESFLRTLKQNKSLENFFHNPSFKVSEKQQVFTKLAEQSQMSLKVKNTFLLLIEKNRSPIYEELVATFIEIKNKNSNTITAMIESAFELNEDQKARIQAAFEKSCGKKVMSEFVLNADLVAGVKATLVGQSFESTLKRGLSMLKENVLSAESSIA